jgi:SET domain-containing protein
MNRGIRTLKSIKKQELLGIYVGRVYPPNKVSDDTTYHFRHNSETNPRVAHCIVDSSIEGNWTRYINYSCNSNIKSRQENVGQLCQI